jgi:hypothetical protein
MLIVSFGMARFSSWSQTSPSTGAIRGTVMDSTGALISGATITITSDNVSYVRQTTSQGDGVFLFPLLPPASGYRLRVEAHGFAPAEQKDLKVRVTEVSGTIVRLTVGSATEQVVVSSATELVETTNPTTGNTLTKELVSTLPLNTRNPLQLLATDAGVASTPGSSTLYVAGSRATENNYTVNGVDANNFEFNTLGNSATPNPDAVEEFRTQTSLFDATNGHSSGGTISLVTRSGTNVYHGNGYWYNRTSALAANDFFFNRQGKPRPFFLRNHFGASAGGPVPDVKSTYFFVNYEGWQQRVPDTLNATAQPVLPETRDAASLAAAFELPVSAIDPVAVKFLNAKGEFGGYAYPGGVGAPGQLGSYIYAANAQNNQDQVTARLDHDLTLNGQDNRISLAGFWNRQDALNPVTLLNGQSYHYNFPSISLSDMHTFSPRLLNEFSLGVTNNVINTNDHVNVVTLDQVGMTRFNSGLYNGMPMLDFATGEQSYSHFPDLNPYQSSYTVTVRDMVSYSAGRHSLRAGFELRKNGFNYSDKAEASGELVFYPIFADIFYGQPINATDSSFRDFLIGAPVGSDIGSGLTHSYYRAGDVAGFAQDDFRLSSRFTLNLGLRYEYLGPITEKYGHIATFDPTLLDANTRMYGGSGLQKGFVTPSTPGVSPSLLYNTDKYNFMPRVGFAWDISGNGKLALRGGWGKYFVRTSSIGALQTISQLPFFQDVQSSNDMGQTQMLNDPFPHLPSADKYPMWPTMPTLTGLDSYGDPLFDQLQLAISGISRNMRTPYVQEWNLTTQYEFRPKWTMEVGYLGSRGYRLLNYQNLDSAQLVNSDNPGPFGLTTNSMANYDARVPYVGFASQAGGYMMETTDADSWYNALLFTVSHPFSHGMYLKAAYTYSRSIDDSSGAPNVDIGTSAGNQMIPMLNKGVSDFNIPQRLVVTYQYNIPTPRFAQNNATRYVVGGWSATGITTYQNGMPFSVTQSPTNTLAGMAGMYASTVYANVVPDCGRQVGAGSLNQRLNNYFNKACFANSPKLVANQTFGPLSPYGGPGNETYTISPGGRGILMGTAATRNIMRAPHLQRWDLALSKDFKLKFLGEAGGLQLRGDFFNLFNNVNFSAPGGYTIRSTYGKITSTADIPRQIQTALRISF